MDFNPTYFTHPKAADGFTLAHSDPADSRILDRTRIACRKIGAAMGQAMGTPCVTNVWIPDGYKDHAGRSQWALASDWSSRWMTYSPSR